MLDEFEMSEIIDNSLKVCINNFLIVYIQNFNLYRRISFILDQYSAIQSFTPALVKIPQNSKDFVFLPGKLQLRFHPDSL